MPKTDHEQIRDRLSALFSEVLHVEAPSADTDLFDAGILDSQRFVELIVELEKNFQARIDIQDFEIENFRSIDTIAALILQHGNGQHVTQRSAVAAMASD